jgi:hypothetical protein
LSAEAQRAKAEALAKEEFFTCPPSHKATAGKPTVCGYFYFIYSKNFVNALFFFRLCGQHGLGGYKMFSFEVRVVS